MSVVSEKEASDYSYEEAKREGSDNILRNGRSRDARHTAPSRCLAMPSCEFSEEILEDESLIDRLVNANGAVSPGVQIIHFRIELWSRPPLGPAAFRVHHHADCRGISEGAMLDMPSVRISIVPLDKLFDQVAA